MKFPCELPGDAEAVGPRGWPMLEESWRRALGAAEPHSVIIRDGRKAKIYLFAAFTGCYFLVSYPDLSVLCIFDLRIQASTFKQ
eukprot:s4807_g5.t1